MNSRISAIPFAARISIALIAFLFAIIPSIALGMSVQAGPYNVDVVTDPPIVHVGSMTLRIYITSNGQPVSDAKVSAIAQMPDMPMGEKVANAVPIVGQPGHYSAPIEFRMEGQFQARIVIKSALGSATATFPIETDENTGPAYLTWTVWTFLPWILGAVLIAVLTYQLKTSNGGKGIAKSLVDRKVLIPLLLLVVGLAAVFLIVPHLTKPTPSFTLRKGSLPQSGKAGHP